MAIIAHNYDRYYGQVFGNGHCVPFVRDCSGAPHTSQWRRGDPAKGGNLAEGTVIATFDPNGKYGNHTDGRSHAAIFLAETEQGLLVVDQWIGHPVDQRTLRFRDGSGHAVNDADRFYVVELAELA
jgi:hypothetical protein